MITRKKFETYVKIQNSGLCNMYDIPAIVYFSESTLTPGDILDIQNNYDHYTDFYKLDNADL